MKMLLLLTILGATGLQDLSSIKTDIDSVRTLQTHGVITTDEAAKYESNLLINATEAAGQPVDYPRLVELTTGNFVKIAKFFTMTRILTIIAGIIAVVAVIALGGHYLVDILTAISPSVYEVLAYATSAGLIYSGTLILPDYRLMTILPGCLLLVGALALTDKVRNIKRDNPDVYALICAFVWGGVAMYYVNPVIGFFSVGALMLSIGFNDMFDPLFGWLRPYNNNSDPSPRVAMAGFAVLGLDVVAQLGHWDVGRFSAFHGSAQWLGTFTFFFSMLWISSVYYDQYYDKYGARYWISQIVYIAGILSAFYLGTVFGFQDLLSVTGWFTGLFILAKYCELPWEGIGWAWASLGIAGFLYILVLFAQKNPQYFIIQG